MLWSPGEALTTAGTGVAAGCPVALEGDATGVAAYEVGEAAGLASCEVVEAAAAATYAAAATS